MVLLTSSTVSGIIFASVVCLFTFLLFLSGYVLQQQTVRSLQEALRTPPEPKPVPTLPAAFQNLKEETRVGVSDVLEETLAGGFNDQQQSVVVNSPHPNTQVLEHEASGLSIDHDEDVFTSNQPPVNEEDARQSLAYILSVPDPVDICSVLLFAKHQRQYSRLQTKAKIMVLYPTPWEASSASVHISALSLMRDLQEELSLTYHPVSMNSGRSRASITSQLLGELQRLRWDYDRAIYLRSPGLAVDVASLDRALASSNIRKSWSPLAEAAGNDPGMLFYAKGTGLMMARGDTRKLTAAVPEGFSDDQQLDEEDSAYFLFDNEQLEDYDADRRNGVVERFLKERHDICDGRGLLPDEVEKIDLKRKAR